VIAQLKGLLEEKGLDAVVVDVGGVGYAVSISLNTLAVLPQVGQPVRLYTYLQVREDALQLFGFATPEERRAFELCIAVSGIGPKIALSVLSGLDARGLAKVITDGDVHRLKRVPGIGPKTAERLVLELRDKVGRIGLGPEAGAARGEARTPSRVSAGAGGGLAADVALALGNLGYKPTEADRAAEAALGEDPGAPIEAVLRRALRLLQRD
jgi:Holliday junction DNA helicase RuvA